MHISIIKGIRLGSTNLQTHKDQREIKECLHIQNTKQITIINAFNKLAAVAADASLAIGLQICGPMPDSFIMEMYITKWKVLITRLSHSRTSLLGLLGDLNFNPYYRGFLNSEVI